MEKNLKLTAAIVNSAARLDYTLTTQFLMESLEAITAHYTLSKDTLSEVEQIRRERMICQGGILLCLVSEGLKNEGINQIQ